MSYKNDTVNTVLDLDAKIKSFCNILYYNWAGLVDPLQDICEITKQLSKGLQFQNIRKSTAKEILS